MSRGTLKGDNSFKLVVYHAGAGLGGMEVSVATALRHLDPRIDVLLIGIDSSVTRWFADKVPNLTVRLAADVRNKWDVPGMLNHLRMIRNLRPDILQVELPTPWSGKYAVLAGILTPGVRVIVEDCTGIPPHSKAARIAKRILVAGTDANIAITNQLARFIEDEAGLKPHTIGVIRRAISDPGPPPTDRPRHDPPVIGTIGRLTRQKGIDVFLRALADMSAVQGVIVGEGEDETALKDLAAELGLADRVSWVGWREDVSDLLNDFDIFVLASRWEGFGRVLVEAALAQCPVISTRVVGTSEAMIEGETGLLVPSDDKGSLVQAINDLLEDEERAREMGRRGRAFAIRGFDPAAIAREYESLYRGLLSRKV